MGAQIWEDSDVPAAIRHRHAREAEAAAAAQVGGKVCSQAEAGYLTCSPSTETVASMADCLDEDSSEFWQHALSKILVQQGRRLASEADHEARTVLARSGESPCRVFIRMFKDLELKQTDSIVAITINILISVTRTILLLILIIPIVLLILVVWAL